MSETAITEHVARRDGHSTFYLAAGPEDGPLLIFLHGWPELSLSWRHQLPALAALGFRCVAPDMRGYGRSSVYPRHEDYALAPIIDDMLALIDHLDRERAVWIGHDWGSPVAWSMARLHGGRCHAVASLCVPYGTIEDGLDGLIALVNRDTYPEAEFPAGQWEYMRYYEEQFERATASMDADPLAMARMLFRKGNPEGRGQVALTARVRQMDGWFGGAQRPPVLPRDPDVVSEQDLCAYAAALTRNGFFGPNSWYMNHERNARFIAGSGGDGRLAMPALFLSAAHDYVCDTVDSRLADPMRARCDDLTWVDVPSGHWMAQECPRQVNAALARWLASRVPDAWPA